METNSPGTKFRTVTYPDWNKIQFSENQAEVFNCTSNKILLNAGRYYGKDHVLIFKALVKAFHLFYDRINNPDWNRFGATVIVMIVTPTETNAIDLWERTKEMLPSLPGIAPNGKNQIHFREDARSIEIFGGEITITFETTTRGANLRGRSTDILVVSECAYHSKAHLVDVLFPCCIRSGYAGIIYMNSSPFGAEHWYDEAVQEMREQRGYFHALGFKLFEGTLYDNPQTSQSEIDALKAIKDSNVYTARREWLGWLNVPVVSKHLLGAGETFAFDGERIQSVKINEPVNTTGPYVIGIDLATTGKDSLAVCVLSREGIVVKLERHAKTELEDILQIIIRLHNTYHPRAIVYDQNMGILRNVNNAELARIAMKPIQMHNLNKVQFVEHLQHHMICKSIRIPDPEIYYRHIDPPLYMRENLFRLFREMHEYRRFTCKQEFQSRGKIEERYAISYHKSIDGTDDMLDSLILAASELPVPYKVRQLQSIEMEKTEEDKPSKPVASGDIFKARSGFLMNRSRNKMF